MRIEVSGLNKENIRTYINYAVVVVLSAGVYIGLTNLGDGMVKALLDFYKTVVEIFFSNSHYYVEDLGYYAGNYYNIGKECLGLGIVALIFGCCGILSVKMLRGYKLIILGIVLSAPAAIISGVIANIFRLISSIYFVTFARFELIHALLGIVIYLSVLFIYYRLFIWLDNRSPIGASATAGVAGDADAADAVDASDASDAGRDGNGEDVGNDDDNEDVGDNWAVGSIAENSGGGDAADDRDDEPEPAFVDIGLKDGTPADKGLEDEDIG